MQDLSVRGAAIDAAIKAVNHLIAAHLHNHSGNEDDRAELLKLSSAIGRWLEDEKRAGR